MNVYVCMWIVQSMFKELDMLVCTCVLCGCVIRTHFNTCHKLNSNDVFGHRPTLTELPGEIPIGG